MAREDARESARRCEAALTDFIRAAVALNFKGKSKPQGRASAPAS